MTSEPCQALALDPGHRLGAGVAGLSFLFCDRAARVTVMVICICVLGVYDLLHTLAYIQTVGMVELNPLARKMIEIGGVQQLVLYKLFTIALSCGILYCLRRTRQAEVCATIGLVVMISLTVYWFVYNDRFVQLAAITDISAQQQLDPRWVYLR